MKIIIIILTCYAFLSLKTVSRQSSGIHAKVSFVDSLVKNKNSHESGFRLTILNDTEQNLYIPNILTLFSYQIADSLFIFRLEDGKKDKLIYRESGAPIDKRPPPFGPATAYLMNQYFSAYKRKKRFGDSIASVTNALRSKRSINPLFLHKKEKFVLYQVSPVDHLYRSSGNYRIDFKIRKRETENLPAEISGFNILTEGIPVESLYITVETLKAGRRIILKDSRQNKIRSFVWR